ncbi:myc box-dependent-interacting protein 1-like isoform X1 [Drosophila miranda]|uniref:myc box-dependent-interacting protein 1-like isoform X1 n=1 Tax=Drosophila miranda TaxID=7229 RepID=UPI00143F14AD|nr:myc box-dependent-interacting protein 1-like isoform X1 [Drosophila miranda]
MSENKGIMLAKSVQKHAGRAKEKILQNLGKVDRTADEIFDDHLNNFNRQQMSANRLQKELNNYIRCVRAAKTASKSLMDAVCEIYEPQWSGYEALQAQTGASDSLWADFAHKLGDQVLIPLNTYTGQLPEMKKKVEKRNRKLIDYDGQRHSFQNLQANASKRKDDVKLTKGREQLEEARRTYEILNTELHDELPALYDSRILFLVTNLQTLFATEQVFHNETSKIHSELEAIVDKLATESQRGSNTLRKQTSNAIKTSSPVQSPVNKLNNASINSTNYQNQITTNGGSSLANSPTSTSSSLQEPRFDSISSTPEPTPESPSPSPPPILKQRISSTPVPTTTSSAQAMDIAELSSPNANTKITTTTQTTTVTKTEEQKAAGEGAAESAAAPLQVNGNGNNNQSPASSASAQAKQKESISSSTASGGGGKHPKELPTTTTNAEAAAEAAANNGNSIEEHKQKKLDANTADLPAGVLYRVKATYGYVKEDVDELSFEIGDTIRVIEYDDPEAQEEGWLMGQKEGTSEKGLFPANFTRPI